MILHVKGFCSAERFPEIALHVHFCIFCNGMDFMHVSRLFAWSKLWSASCHSEHGKKRLSDGCATLIYWSPLVSKLSTISGARGAWNQPNPSSWNHSMLAFPHVLQQPFRVKPTAEAQIWFQARCWRPQGRPQNFLLHLVWPTFQKLQKHWCPKTLADHPRTAVGRIYHFNTGAVFKCAFMWILHLWLHIRYS